MDNITRIVQMGVYTGCGACSSCKHIQFTRNSLGFDSPIVDDECEHCGKCIANCCFDPLKEDDNN